jgi:hypothetical protein
MVILRSFIVCAGYSLGSLGKNRVEEDSIKYCYVCGSPHIYQVDGVCKYLRTQWVVCSRSPWNWVSISASAGLTT